MADVAAAFELPCFAYLSLPPRSGSSKPQLISSYPVAWTSHYLASRYERVDPVIRQAASTPQPFEWGLGCGDRKSTRLNPVTNAHLVCRLLLEKKKQNT